MLYVKALFSTEPNTPADTILDAISFKLSNKEMKALAEYLQGLY